MTPELIGILGIVAMLILFALKMWIGAALALVSIVGITLLKSWDVMLSVVSMSSFTNLNAYTFTVIPTFTLMGMVIAETAMGSDLYDAAYKWIGKFKGGLASATVAACGLIGAVTGSIQVGVLIISRIAMPEMRKNNYDESFASGAVAAGAPLAILIPPSIGFIIYGILAEVSIGKLFISGLGVGIVQIIIYIIFIWFKCKVNPSLAPSSPRFEMKVKLKSLLKIIPTVLLMIVVLGGIYAGFFTATEAGAIGAFGAIVISLAYRQMTVKKFTKALKDTALICGMVFFLVASTYVFVTFMSLSRVPALISALVKSLAVPNWVLALALVFMYYILGMFIPEVPMIALTVPILYPSLTAVGFDPIWLGAFMVKMMAVGSISPPVGMTVYLMGGLTKIPVEKIFKGVIPYLSVDLIIIILLIIFPQIATFLPSLM